MPYLSLSSVNFRNLQNATIDLLAKEVFFIGENGQGKSNLLEALYYSAYGNSFRTRVENELITNGQKDFSLKALYRDAGGSVSTIFSMLKDGKKSIQKNGKKIHDRKELINTIPTVLFCHDDLDFATGEPERRRFFIDQSLSMYDALYIDVLRNYKKILKSRNVVLKEKNYGLLPVLNQQLANNGVEIQKKRGDTVFQFNQLFGDLYAQITDIDGVRIHYSPSWKEAAPECALQTLLQKEDMDKALGTTMSGPHRDRIFFVRDGRNFIPKASTGQRRLAALILRVAQALYYTRLTGKKPVLLMDDVMLELDPEKRQRFTALLPEYEQLFCTFLPGEPYQCYKKSATKVYAIKNGVWNSDI